MLCKSGNKAIPMLEEKSWMRCHPERSVCNVEEPVNESNNPSDLTGVYGWKKIRKDVPRGRQCRSLNVVRCHLYLQSRCGYYHKCVFPLFYSFFSVYLFYTVLLTCKHLFWFFLHFLHFVFTLFQCWYCWYKNELQLCSVYSYGPRALFNVCCYGTVILIKSVTQIHWIVL